MKTMIHFVRFCVPFASLLLLTSLASAEDFYGFSHVLKGQTRTNKNTAIQPSLFETNDQGGVIQVRMPNTAGTCVADYEFRWFFIDDISRLEVGKKYRFNMVGRRIGGTCQKNNNQAWVKSSISASTLARKARIADPGRSIELLTNRNGISAYPANNQNTLTGTISLVGGATADTNYFTFVFSFSSFPYSSKSKLCDFEIVYVYKKNYVAPGDNAVLIKSQPGREVALPQVRTFEGTWISKTFGTLTMRRVSGISFSGNYTYNNGEIHGSVTDGTFSGRWYEVDSSGQRKSGPVVLPLSRDGNSIDGKFGYGFDQPTKSWILKRAN